MSVSSEYYEISGGQRFFVREQSNGIIERMAAPLRTSLTVALSSGVVATGTTVAGTLEVRHANDALVAISGTYYVPVIGVDGRQVRLLTVQLNSGQGSVAFAIAEPGIYTVRTDLIRPVPTAVLSAAPELIVTEP